MTIIENALYHGVGIQNEVSPDLPLQIKIKKNDPTPSKVPFWRVLRSYNSFLEFVEDKIIGVAIDFEILSKSARSLHIVHRWSASP